MAAPGPWLAQPFALVHGEDGDGRRAAVEAWKARHVDAEWADFALTLCPEGCPWAEVLAALHEAPPLGAASRTVVVPAADNLFARAKDLPPAIRAALEQPPPGVALLLVAWTTLSAAPGKALGAKPWTDWAKAGRILKVGVLDPAEIPGFVAEEARRLGLVLEGGVAARLAERQGGHPGMLKRALEVLDLMADNRRVTEALVDQATFRLAEQRAFAWTGAWQKGDAAGALKALRLALEDGDEPLALLGQARREVDRLLKLAEADAAGLRGGELLSALGFSPRQAFLLDGAKAALARLGPAGVKGLVVRVNQCERDLKGMALSRSQAPLLDLTLALCRAWGR